MNFFDRFILYIEGKRNSLLLLYVNFYINLRGTHWVNLTHTSTLVENIFKAVLKSWPHFHKFSNYYIIIGSRRVSRALALGDLE